ncbi:MAG TPA: hypothetical protein VEY12_07675 [Thermoplasmata archaeon]|nr:hypothetical protein [Thermoplasmata archaeon]
MPWRALLRVVDFQELLTSQATLAEALEASRRDRGADSDAARTLREGFNLLAKVLFTQRATARDVHDLAWLDHLVVSRELGPAKLWRAEAVHEALDHLAGDRGRIGELIPGRHPTWVDVPLVGVGGLRTLKAECGTTAALRSGVVAQDGLLVLLDEIGSARPRTKEAAAILEDVQRLALAARRAGGESVSLVLTSSRVV